MTTPVTLATTAVSPQNIASLTTFFYTMRVVAATWGRVRAAHMAFQHPQDYAIGTGVQFLFDRTSLRAAAYVTIATHCTMNWIREWNGLQESYGRFKATLFGEFSTKIDTTYKERIDDIYTASALLFEQTSYFLAATLELIDVLSINISGEESIRRLPGHFRALLEAHSSDPEAWIKELRNNIPLIDSILPHLPVPTKKSAPMIRNLEIALIPAMVFDVNGFWQAVMDVVVPTHAALVETLVEEHPLYTKKGLFKNG